MQLANEEGESVGRLVDLLGRGCPRAMTGLRFDSDQNRIGAALRGLKRSNELEGVSGHDAIVVISRERQRRRIARAGFDVVER